jgi:hypothetical protein
MAFVATGFTNNFGGQNTTVTTGAHGFTINEGDLVVCYVHTNDTGSPSPDQAGWTTALDEVPTSETARQALYWRVAGGSEPTSYTWTISNAFWHCFIGVFTSDTDAEVDLAATSAITSTNTWTDVRCEAGSGRSVAANAVSFVFGGKDRRGSTEAYTTADNSYTGAAGNVEDQVTAGAYRIWTTGGTDSIITIDVADADDGQADYVYSIHASFVEGGGGGGIIPQAKYHYQHNTGSGL